jgi:hypothetical protein
MRDKAHTILPTMINQCKAFVLRELCRFELIANLFDCFKSEYSHNDIIIARQLSTKNQNKL